MKDLHDVAKILTTQKLVAVIITQSFEEAYNKSVFCIKNGVKAVEIAFNVPDAPKVINLLLTEYGDTVTVGAGNVLNLADAFVAVRAGAQFAVSPCFKPELIEYFMQNGVFYVPGVYTATEIMNVADAGAETVKLFPSDFNLLKNCQSIFPELKFMISAQLNDGTAAFAGQADIIEHVIDYDDAAEFKKRINTLLR